jgi:hypothetical protein
MRSKGSEGSEVVIYPESEVMSMPPSPGPASKGRRRVSGQILGRTGGNGQAQTHPAPRIHRRVILRPSSDMGKGYTAHRSDRLVS